KAKNPNDQAEVTWRTELFKKLTAARNNLVTLRQLQAEGESHTNPTTTTLPENVAPITPPTTTPTTPPTTEPVTPPRSNAVVTAPSSELVPMPPEESGALVPVTEGALTLVTPQVVEQATRPQPPSPETEGEEEPAR